MQAAQVRADEMAASSVYSHTRPDGRKYITVTDCPYIGENIHLIGEWQIRDSSLPSFAVEAWKNSAAHLKNMLNTRYHAIGVGVSQGTVMGEPTGIAFSFSYWTATMSHGWMRPQQKGDFA